MSLFQVSVQNSYINQLNIEEVKLAYKKYKKYFLDSSIQENIKKSKEEQFQAIFLNELFVNILGYTLNPSNNFNLTTEYKNETNARKADGAILISGSAIAVIELKGTNTKDLDSISRQAFDYKVNNKNCKYVITSNFQKLRFYINDASEKLDFNLFTLTLDEFKLLFLCLSKTSLLNDLPYKIKELSILNEKEITDGFYFDYSNFKRKLYRDLVLKNSKSFLKLSDLFNEEELQAINVSDISNFEKNVKLTLFKKSQKLLDRFLFIFFAEDKGLLPVNFSMNIVKEWQSLQSLDIKVSLYERFKLYFNYLDKGRPASINNEEVYAYNGGLFKTDLVLDKLLIDNELLLFYTKKISEYNFDNQVDVNVLGHIFENSINEIESLNAEIDNEIFDKQKSKRKKDGVFYTPNFITKYIVDISIGSLCKSKKEELGFSENEYYKSRKGRKEVTLKKLINILDDYRSWLLNLTICDPACGSGAFLNESLNFLIKEHNYIDELKIKLLGGGLPFNDIEKVILENNIYGVDINDESIEIAKLSLWLRTTQPHRKLNDLSENIKCGNSLIDIKSIAGEKAFNWCKAFPKVFKNGGFDVIIGNPPYVSFQSNLISDNELKFFNKKYSSCYKIFDLYGLFIEKSKSLLKDGGAFSFICPSPMLMNDSFSKLRSFIDINFSVDEIVMCEDGVFQSAVVPTIIFKFTNSIQKNTKVLISETNKNSIIPKDVYDYSFFMRNPKAGFNISLNKNTYHLLKKAEEDSINLGELLDIRESIKTGDDKLFISTTQIDENYLPLVTGKDVSRYHISQNKYLNYDITKLKRPTKIEYFTGDKLFIRRVGSRVEAVLDKCNFLSTHVLYLAKAKSDNFNLEYLLALLNSSLINQIYHLKFPPKGKVFPEIRIGNLRQLPIKNISKVEQFYFTEKVNDILKCSSELNDYSNKFLNTLLRHFELDNPSKKLKEWYRLDYNTFLSELKKKKIKLSLSAESEWESFFETQKTIAKGFYLRKNNLIDQIDLKVMELYQINISEFN